MKPNALRFLTLLRLATLFAIAGALAACGLIEGDGRALQPLSQITVARLEAMGSSPAAPMIVRIIKQDNVLEVWKQVKDGTFKRFKSYDICAWSGELGPKIKEGDRQAPEGFYNITPGLMNPRSNYYLAFNTGYPNKFDRAWGRTGSQLMVHGDCSSRGCYAMTDEQIAEIYALGREAFKGGQRSFLLMIFPFDMTLANMVKYRHNPNIAFWWNLKQGWDAFELSHREIKWDVCQRRYVFFPAGGPLNASGACPAQSTAPQLMADVSSKESSDKTSFAAEAAAADKADAQKQAQDAAALQAKEERDAAINERTAAISGAVEGSTSAISNAVGGLFSSLFGSGTGTTATSASTQTAPIPAPAPDRN